MDSNFNEEYTTRCGGGGERVTGYNWQHPCNIFVMKGLGLCKGKG